MFSRVVLAVLALGLCMPAAFALAATANTHAATATLFPENTVGYGWYGASFQSSSIASMAGTTDSDLSAQNYASITRPDDPNGNTTPVGRFEDDAERAFKVSSLGLTNVNHSFTWGTYSVDSHDFGKKDDVLFTESCLAAVPEPSAALLSLLGLFTLGGFREFKKYNKNKYLQK